MSTPKVYRGDLPDGYDAGTSIAIDTETMGLRPHRDDLCVVQLSRGDGKAAVIQLDRSTYHAPNLCRVLTDPSVTKIFHFARFDVAVLKHFLKVDTSPIYCTKIASKLVRTYTDRHGLKDLARELADVDMNKQQQSSDWGAVELSAEQLAYASSDVLYLHKIKQKLDVMLEREGRTEIAHQCFNFLPTRCDLDLAGWEHMDIFSHSS